MSTEKVTELAVLRTGQVADAAGVTRQTLRYYERRGLLAQPARSLGGQRLYPTQVVVVLRAIKAAQRLGFTLDEVARLLEVGRGRPGKGAEVGLQAQARVKVTELEERIQDLQRTRSDLLAALDVGCDDLVECANAECCPLPFVEIGHLPS